MESIDFDFLLEKGEGDEPSRDPRIVRSIEEASLEAEARLSRRATTKCGAPTDDDLADDSLGMTDDDVLALDESDLECLWPAWGDRRAAQLGRGIPPGVTVVPQHLPKSASYAGRPLNYAQ